MGDDNVSSDDHDIMYDGEQLVYRVEYISVSGERTGADDAVSF